MNITFDENSKLTFYDLILIWIGIVSALIIIALCIGKFSPPVILIGSVITTIMVLILVKIHPINEVRFTLVFLLLLFLALLFRYSNATHYMGGQDQGLYVIMSDELTENGKIEFVDKLRESLPDGLKAEYDTYKEPGVGGVDDPERSTYSIDFYPMHPAWMAMATFLFGPGRHILSLLFFSLVGLTGMYLLTMELTNDDKKAGYIALLFGALNPGLVYFTTFPVGEMVALCFSINGFYLLSRGFHCEDKRLRSFFLAGSALLFSAFCYTRMTLFIFFPVLFVVLFIAFFFDKHSHLRISLSVYLVSLIVLYALSWVFYYEYQIGLADPMYERVFRPIVAKYGVFAFISIILMIALLYFVSQTKFRSKLYMVAENLVIWLEGNVALFLFIALALSFIFIPKLYIEGINSPILIKPYPLIFHFSNLYALMLFISPALLIMLFLFPFIRLKLQRVQILLIFFLITPWLTILIYVPYHDYLYYYGRYYCSEMVPYSLILCGIVLSMLLDKAKWKRIAIITASVSVVYFALFSAVQIGHRETENPEVLYQLDRIVGSTDVIIYENAFALGDREYGASDPGLLLTTPLRLFFDKQVYRLQNTSITAEERFRKINYFYNHSAENSGVKYSIIYLLEHKPLNSDIRNSVTLIGKFDYSFGRLINPYQFKTGPLKEINTWKQLLLPYYYSEYHAPIYLYRVDKRLMPQRIPLTDFNIDFSQDGNSGNFDLTGISVQEKNFRWTDGNNATISTLITPTEKSISKCQLMIVASAFTNSNKPTQRFGIVVNGTEIGWGKDSGGGEFLFDIPIELINNTDRLTIELLLPDATSPASTGSADARLLGLALQKMQFIVFSSRGNLDDLSVGFD